MAAGLTSREAGTSLERRRSANATRGQVGVRGTGRLLGRTTTTMPRFENGTVEKGVG